VFILFDPSGAVATIRGCHYSRVVFNHRNTMMSGPLSWLIMSTAFWYDRKYVDILVAFTNSVLH